MIINRTNSPSFSVNLPSEKSQPRKIWRHLKIMLIISAAIILLGVYFFKFAPNYPLKQDLKHRPGFFGVTFSKKFCEEMGLDWHEVYAAIINDLKVKEIRLPIYWDEIEKERGEFDFSDYDYMINEGAKNGVKFIANIGWRLPRWPECHAPSWATKKSLAATEAATLNMLTAVVNHYKDNPAVTAWQVENEPFFNAFGLCPPGDEDFFTNEVNTIKRFDNRPVVVSATGELSFWRREVKLADIFGSTLYRVVWGPLTGYIRYPIPAWFYRFKAWLVGLKPEERIIIELQGEPWVPSGNIIYMPGKEINKSMNLKQFRANLQYAINVNFSKTYIWGVEWWYWQYKNGEPGYWELVRTLFN